MDCYLSVRDFFSSTKDPGSSLQKIAPIAQISLEKSKKVEIPKSPFEIVNGGMLRVNVKELTWVRTASLTANRGDLRFARNPGLFNEGLGTFLYKAFMGESSFLAVVEGEGIVYLSTGFHKVVLIYVNDETINIQGCNILAFERRLKHKIEVMGDLSGLAIGGLSFVNFSGSGWIAVAVCGEPVTIESRAEYALETIPVRT
ncbi:AIM24 family protein, partial [bacterium]|nr:AIM24 family protein [bacterium]